MRRILCLLFGALAAVSTCYAQVGPKQEENNPYREEARNLVFDLRQQIGKIDEPTLRIFIRVRYATSLWSGKLGPDTEPAVTATAESLEDLLANEKNLLPLYRNSFRRDLLALARLHSPELIKKYADRFAKSEQSSLDVANTMLSAQNGVSAAVQTAESNIVGGQFSGTELMAFLIKLEKQQPALIPGLLTAILDAEEVQPSSHLVEDLFWLQSFYLRPDNPDGLKKRFLSLVLSATSNSSSMSDPQAAIEAYDLLSGSLPQIQAALPSSYPQAQIQLVSLSTQVGKGKQERDRIEERIKQSDDPLGQAISEAHSASNQSLKDELLSEAVQLAIEKGKLELALNLTKEISDDETNQVGRDELLADIVNKAVKKVNNVVAEKAAREITSPLRRAAALQEIALGYLRANDTNRSKETLLESVKQIALADNGSPKAVAFLQAADISRQIDSTMVLDLLRSSMDVTDRYLFQQEGETDSQPRFDFENHNTVAVAWHLIPVVQFLVKSSGGEALNLIPNVNRPGIKAAVLLGASIAMSELAKEKATPHKPTPKAERPAKKISARFTGS